MAVLAGERAHQVVDLEPGRRFREHVRTPAQHGDVVGNRQRLLQLVGHQHDRSPVGHKVAQPPKEFFRFPGREHGGWLIEDQRVRVAGQRLQYLHALLGADAEGGNPRVGVNGESRSPGECANARGHVPRAKHPVPSQRDVLGGRHCRHEREVLVHHAESTPHGVGARGEHHGLVFDSHGAGVGAQHAEGNAHQRRLAGAVLAEHRVQGTAPDGQ